MSDLVVDEEARYERKLPQLGDDNGRLVDAIGVDRWMREWQADVDRAVEEVEAMGVDRCIEALKAMGVIVQRREWDEL